MSLVSVKIRGMVITSQFGTLVSGDILRCSAEFARHIVEDCKAGEYVTAKADEPEATTEKPRRGRKGR